MWKSSLFFGNKEINNDNSHVMKTFAQMLLSKVDYIRDFTKNESITLNFSFEMNHSRVKSGPSFHM